jgi:putative tryptophan/tyrosine transport system substrate-binding protein
VPSQLEALYKEAAATNVTLIEIPAFDSNELRSELESINESVDAILMIAEPIAVTPDAFEILSRFAAERGIPIGGALMTAGGYSSAFGVSTDNVAVGRQAAVIADKILRGVNAGKIPVASAESFVQINYTAIQRLGLNVSEGLLSQANQIIH